MDQPPVERPKRPRELVKIVLSVILVCALAGVALYFIHFRHKPNTSSANLVQQKINFNVDENNCKNHIVDLAKTDISKLSALQAAQIYSQRGNCYLTLGQNKDALQAYESMLTSCNQQTQFSGCSTAATNDIQIARDAINASGGPPKQ
jgi:uncharacterized membrane protein